jgi:predicted deacylase
MSGTVVGIPIMGPLAFLSRSRAGILDYEHFNLNRLWPGDPNAFLTQRIAHAVFESAVSKADYLLDYHEGGVALLARYLLLGGSESTIAKVGARQIEMARWFGMGIPFAYRVTSDENVRVGKLGNLTEAAGQIGIPAISVELGGGGMYRPDLLEVAIKGTERVLQGAGILPGGLPQLDPDQIMVRETTWLRPRRGGFLVPTPQAILGSQIAASTKLASVVDPFGDIVDDLVAPHDAIVLDVRLQASVYPGDWSYHLAKL